MVFNDTFNNIAVLFHGLPAIMNLFQFTTQYYFTLSFPALFPYGTGDFFLLIDQGLFIYRGLG